MSYLKENLPQLLAAQTEFAQALPAGRVLLVDHTLGRVANAARAQAATMAQTPNLNPEVADYLKDVQEFGLPEHTHELYRQFFGLDLPMVSHKITEAGLPDLNGVSCVILSGSPANISTALADPTAEIAPGCSNKDVLDRSSAVVRLAMQKNIPVIGMCYGHQVMSYVMGGEVHRFPSPSMGLIELSIPDPAQQLLKQWNLDAELFSGTVPAFHQDHAVLSSRSQSMFEAQLSMGVTNYAAAHGKNGVTVQYHPEYWAIEPLLTSSRTHTNLRLPVSGLASINTLRLFTAWLRAR